MLGLDPVGVQCSRASCRAEARHNVHWRNPKIHGIDRVKVWSACDEHVDFLAGGLQTPEMLAISPVLDELKMPTIAMFPAGSASPYLLSLNFPYDRGYAKTMADFLAWLNKDKGWHIKNVALVYSNYEAGQKVNEALKGTDVAAIKSAVEELANESQQLGSALYAQTQADAAAAGGDGSASGNGAADGSSSQEEEIVDAEIVDEAEKK